MIHRFFFFLPALFYSMTGSSQIIWAEESTYFDLHFEPITLIAVSEQEIELSPSSPSAAPPQTLINATSASASYGESDIYLS